MGLGIWLDHEEEGGVRMTFWIWKLRWEILAEIQICEEAHLNGLQQIERPMGSQEGLPVKDYYGLDILKILPLQILKFQKQ